MHKKILFLITSFLLFLFVPEIMAATSLTYQYDTNGNLISGDGKFYEYNDANQLIRVRHSDQAGPVLSEYFYDYTGQRVKKIENRVTTYYIGKHFEKQVDSSATVTTTSYYFANGERVAKKDASANMYYYHLDHLGGTNVITDSSGNIVERIKYYPFGETREGGNEKYQFTGKEKDALTDFYYFEARYYNPEFKHFTQADTIAPHLYDPQDLNRYAYVRNNPLKFIDPTGHEKVGTNDWNKEFARASKYDRAKFERMRREYTVWVTHGGPKNAADLAYQMEMIRGYNIAITEVQLMKDSADLGVTFLSKIAGPAGKVIEKTYEGITLGVDLYGMAPKYMKGNFTTKQAVRDLGSLSLNLAGKELDTGFDKLIGYGATGISKAAGHTTINAMLKPLNWSWNLSLGD